MGILLFVFINIRVNINAMNRRRIYKKVGLYFCMNYYRL